MASVIWDVGREMKDCYEYFLDVVENGDIYSREELLKVIEIRAKSLRDSYNDLSEDHGWE